MIPYAVGKSAVFLLGQRGKRIWLRVYEVTHSLLIAAIIGTLISLINGAFWWPILAWFLHILMDIPTHTRERFPTPFLWPLSKFTFNGIDWRETRFLLLNYGSIAICLLIIFFTA